MIRKIVTALILVPIAIVFVMFAVANRHVVVISFDPFDQTHPALALSLPLFALIFVLLIAGVVLGGTAAWLRQGKWRWRARHFEAEARALRTRIDQDRRQDEAAGPVPPARRDYPIRLTIPPPAA